MPQRNYGIPKRDGSASPVALRRSEDNPHRGAISGRRSFTRARIRVALGYVGSIFAIAVIAWIVLYYRGEHRDRYKVEMRNSIAGNQGVGK